MNKKYQQLLDDEVLGFIKHSASFLPENTASLPIAQRRAVYNRLCKHFHAGYPPGVEAQDDLIDAGAHRIPVRRYRSSGSTASAQIIYFHGGGFVIGDLNSHDDICAEFCDQTGYLVTSVDYRLAPEHIHPAAFNDALAAYRHQCESAGLPVILAGDSAGATLAAAVAHATRTDEVRPVAQVLIYPALGGDVQRGSYLEHAHAPMLTTEDMLFYYRAVSGGGEISHDPTFLPLMDADFSGLPPTVIFTADCDPLRDDGHDYQHKILQAGGQVEWTNERGLVHGYLRARHSVKRARESFSRIVGAMNCVECGD
ncbi:MAG: alpha/beta hydrolase [Thiolinea sp.]